MELRERLAVRVLVVALLCSCSAKDKFSPAALRWFNEAALHLQNSAGVATEEGQPFTGIVYALLPNGKDTATVMCFADGKEDGEWRRYFANGQLMERRYFERGKKAGTYTAWWPNGRQRLLYHFANGEYEGTCRDWNDKGLLIAEMNYKEGHEEGPQKQFYNNGKIKANYIIRNGRRYGLLGTKNCVNVSDSVFKDF